MPLSYKYHFNMLSIFTFLALEVQIYISHLVNIFDWKNVSTANLFFPVADNVSEATAIGITFH